MNTSVLEGYDPLGDSHIGAPAIEKMLQESQKRDVLNVLRSYTGTLDVFSEAIQNAIDAVEQRLRRENGFTPRIWITVDMKTSALRFVDNGIGMSPEEVKFFLRPNVSFKKDQNLRGQKGVGATFLAYGYSSFSVATKQNDFSASGILTGGRQWAESPTENIPRPKFVGSDFNVEELKHERSGTCIEVTLGTHRDERPRLSWLNIVNPKIWHQVFRLRTPVGGVYLQTGGIKPQYVVRVITPAGEMTEYVPDVSESEFFLPHDFQVCNRNQDLNAISKKLVELDLHRKEMAAKLPADFRNLDCIWNIWDKNTIIDEENAFREDFSDDQLGLISQHDVCVYGCFVRSRTVWEHFQQSELGIRPQYKVIHGGLQLASDYMVQGDLVTIPLTTAAGYQAFAFIIVHFTNGNPDMGRKVFQPELKEIADVLSRRVVSELRKFQPLLKPDTGAGFSNASKQLDDWKDDQKEWAKTQPLRLKINGRELSLISSPREEQDVIALFHELVGMDIIRGLKFFSTGYNTRYDSLYKYHYAKEHIFQIEKCFWGVDPNIVPGESGALVLEYKYSYDSLLRDVEKDEKNPKDLNLVVCWELGTETKKLFDLSSYLTGHQGGTRETFGATHAAFSGAGRGTKTFEIICLSDFLEYYSDPKALIAKHEANF